MLLTAAAFIFAAAPAYGHFGMLIPSDSMVMQDEKRMVKLELSFSHPFDRVGMDMEKPEKLTVYHDGKTSGLRDELIETEIMGRKGWKANYRIKRPGTHIFAMTPEPYWEPAEDLFIIHYTKTYVAAFGDDEGWDSELGLAAEIVPLSRPFALYTGNVFQGIVKFNGKPAAHAEVEVEHYNRQGKAAAPNDFFTCQTVKADENGVFTYTPPAEGWWGFSALDTADYKIEKNGGKKDVELGAVLWVRFDRWMEKE